MKGCLFATFAAFACSLFLGALRSDAQQSNVSSTSSVDINGNVVPDGPAISQTKSDDESQTTVTTQSINGRTVPMERVEEQVLRNDASGKVTERIVQRYDPQGNPLPPQRQMIEEQKRPDGSSTTQSTTYTTDINGNTQITEKSVTDTQKNASGETSETEVQRPTVNGLETVEKQSEVVSKQGKNYQADTTTYRRDGNGGFFAAVRQTTDHTVQGSESSDNTRGIRAGPRRRTPASRPDCNENRYAAGWLQRFGGRHLLAQRSGHCGRQRIRFKAEEQQMIESAPGPNNTVVQTLNVRRPTVSDPGTLGPARQLSETVCKGDCKPPKDK